MSGANTPNLVAVRYEERLRLFAESPRLASHLNLTAGALIWESGKNRSHQASETNCSLGSLSPRNARPQSWKPRSPFVNSPNCSPISAEERIGNHFPADCEGSRQFGFEHVSGLTILVPTQRDVSDLTILVPTQRDWFRTKRDWFRTKRDWFRTKSNDSGQNGIDSGRKSNDSGQNGIDSGRKSNDSGQNGIDSGRKGLIPVRMGWFRFWGGWFGVGTNNDIQSVETNSLTHQTNAGCL